MRNLLLNDYFFVDLFQNQFFQINDLKENSSIEDSCSRKLSIFRQTHYFRRYKWEKLISISLDFKEAGNSSTYLIKI